MGTSLPRLYPIVDEGVLVRSRIGGLSEFAGRAEGGWGVRLLQYRNKTRRPQEMLRKRQLIREVLAGSGCRLILNDRADLAVLAGWDGVHVGQGDLSPEDARRVVGAQRWVGVSTHTEEQVQAADASCADYVAVGPVFATGTKMDAEPVIGLEGVAAARTLTTEAAGRDRRDYARECPKRDRCRGGFGRRDQRADC